MVINRKYLIHPLYFFFFKHFIFICEHIKKKKFITLRILKKEMFLL